MTAVSSGVVKVNRVIGVLGRRKQQV